MKTATITLTASLLSFFCCTVLPGQQTEVPSISTDRPSVATGTDLIPTGSLQQESGISWSHSGHTEAFDGPESFLRVGVSDRIELRATLPNMNWSPGQSGIYEQDASLGTKVRIVSGSRKWPLTTGGAVSFPTGSRELTSGGVDPSVFLATSHMFPHNILFFSSVDVASVSVGDAGRSRNTQFGADVDWCVTPKACLFVEGAPFTSSVQNASGYTTDAGMTWALAPRVQLDWRGGTTVQGGGHTVFVSIGYSRRRDR